MTASILVSLFCSSCATVSGPFSFERIRDLYYTEEKIERQSGDLFLPEVKGRKFPVVIVVHGGGWSGGSKYTMKMVSKSLAANGFAVYNINYRLAPKFQHPTPYEDLQLALAYLEEISESHNLDMTRIGLWGYSAGGHIVSYFALRASQQEKAPPIKAVVSGGAPYDLTWYAKSPYIRTYLGDDRDAIPERSIEASPVTHITNSAPPFFLYHALSDDLVVHPQSTAFEFHLKQAGVHVERHNVPFWGHRMTVMMSESANQAGVDFLQKFLR